MANTDLQTPEDALSYIAPIGELLYLIRFDAHCVSPNHSVPWCIYAVPLACCKSQDNGKVYILLLPRRTELISPHLTSRRLSPPEYQAGTAHCLFDT